MMKIARAVGTLLAGSSIAVMGLAAEAQAQGPPTANQTIHLDNVTEIQVGVFACTGQESRDLLTDTGVIHVTTFSDGTVHYTGTLHGTVAADFVPADGTTDFTGTFLEHFHGSGQLNPDGSPFGKATLSFELNGSITFADGSTVKIHENDHTVFDSSGIPKLDFSRISCR